MNIDNEIKKARLTRKPLEVSVLGSLKNALSNKALSKGSLAAPLSDLEVLEVIRKQVKQRQDSYEAFKVARRWDLVDVELAEKEILERYLPQALSETELNEIVLLAVAETGAVSKKDMGKAIKRAVELASGRAEGKVISNLVGKILE